MTGTLENARAEKGKREVWSEWSEKQAGKVPDKIPLACRPKRKQEGTMWLSVAKASRKREQHGQRP